MIRHFFKMIKECSWLNFFDRLVYLLSALGLIYIISGNNFLYGGYGLGLIGLIYWSVYICIWICNPVKRDWILVNSHIMRRIATGVLLAPFVIVFLYGFSNIEKGDSQIPSTVEQGIGEVKSGTDEKACCWLDDACTNRIATDTEECKRNDVPSNNTTSSRSTSIERSDSAEVNIFMEVIYNYMDPGTQKDSKETLGFKWAAIIAALGVFLMNGLLVSTIVGWFDRRREQWLKGCIRYKNLFFRNPYVIIGGNEMSIGIVKDIFKRDPHALVLIATTKDVEVYRRILYSNIEAKYCERTVIYYGNRTSIEDIKALHLDKAQKLYILGEDVEFDDNESHHDALNMECLELVAQTCKEQRSKKMGKLESIVMFEYQSTFSIFQFSEISESIKNFLRFIPFNRYEMWAQKVLICKEMKDFRNCNFLPLEGFEGIRSTDDHFVHLVIIDMSRMGTALAIETAHLAHYPNFITKKIRTRITFIDSNMSQEYDFFRGRFDALMQCSRIRYIDINKASGPFYADEVNFPWKSPAIDKITNNGKPYLGEDLLDIEWEFIDGSVEKPAIQEYLSEAATHPSAKLTIAVCSPETNKSVATAIYLPNTIFQNALQVLIYQSTNDALISNFSNNQRLTPFNNKLKGFGMLCDTYDRTIVEDSYRIANKVYETYQTIAYQKDGESEERKKYRKKAEELTMIFDKDRAVFTLKKTNAKDNLTSTDSEIQKKEKQLIQDMNEEMSLSMKGKTPVCSWWSDQYSANSLWTKLRCIGTLGQQLTDEQLWMVSNVEHQRWNMEQLLMLYSPATLEQQLLIRSTDSYDQFLSRKDYFKRRMIHYDICSTSKLREIDDSFLIDIALSDTLLDIMRFIQNKSATS